MDGDIVALYESIKSGKGPVEVKLIGEGDGEIGLHLVEVTRGGVNI